MKRKGEMWCSRAGVQVHRHTVVVVKARAGKCASGQGLGQYLIPYPSLLYCGCSPAGSTQSSFLLCGSLTRAWVGTMPQLSQKPSGEFSTCLLQWPVKVGALAPLVYTSPPTPSNNKQEFLEEKNTHSLLF